MSVNYEEIVRGLFAEWNDHGGELTARYFDPEVELDTRRLPQPDFQGVYRGLNEYTTWARTWLSAWDNAQQHPVWIESTGNMVVAWVRLRLVGKHSGIGTDQAHGGWAFRFREGKIVHIRLIADEAETRAAQDD